MTPIIRFVRQDIERMRIADLDEIQRPGAGDLIERGPRRMRTARATMKNVSGDTLRQNSTRRVSGFTPC